MNEKILVGFVLFVSALALTALYLVSESTIPITHSSTQTQELDIERRVFGVLEPSYLDTQCTEDAVDAYISILLQHPVAPRMCSVEVNAEMIRVERDLIPSCRGHCPAMEFTKTVHLGAIDPGKDHVIRICCDGVCSEKKLARAC